MRIKKNEYHIPAARTSLAAKNLIERLLQADPCQRPNMQQVLADEFFTSGTSSVYEHNLNILIYMKKQTCYSFVSVFYLSNCLNAIVWIWLWRVKGYAKSETVGRPSACLSWRSRLAQLIWGRLDVIYCQLGNAYFCLQEYEKALEFHKHDFNLAK